MKYIRVAISDNWRIGLTVFGIALLFVASFAYKLVGLTKGMDNYEQRVVNLITSDGISPLSLVRESLWLPHDLYLFVLQYLPLNSSALFWARAFGVMLAMAAIYSLYFVLSKWHSPRIALLGVAGFAYSAWLLIVSRYATPLALYVMPLIALAGWTAMRHGYRRLGLLVTSLASLACVYIPGLIWLLAVAVVLQRKQIPKFLKTVSQPYIYGLLAVGIIGLIPLVASIIWPPIASDPFRSLLSFIGIPSSGITVPEFAQNLVRVIQALFWHQEYAHVLSVGLAPMLSFLTSVTCILGIVELIQNRTLDRSKLLLLWLLIGWVLAALGDVSVVILLPVLFLISAQGLWYLLDMWLSTFPRNPVARNLGIGLIVCAVSLSVLYGLASYFLAWPHTTFVLTEFVH